MQRIAIMNVRPIIYKFVKEDSSFSLKLLFIISFMFFNKFQKVKDIALEGIRDVNYFKLLNLFLIF